MKKYIILFILLCSTTGFGQNLVLNPGFENTSSCPLPYMSELTGPGLFPPWTNSISGGTSNFDHPCRDGGVSVYYADNPPHSGLGYATLISLRPTSCTWQAPLREYHQGKLCAELEAGKEYRLSFWVSRYEFAAYTSDGIGMCVSAAPLSPYSGWGEGVLLTPAQTATTLFNPTWNMIGHEWEEISGTIVANGGEKFVTLGYFNPVSEPNYQFDPSKQDQCNVTFSIDDISVTEVTPLGFCAHSLWIENKTYAADELETAGMTIHAGYNVGYPTPNGNVTVTTGNNVEYLAGQNINLNPGFIAIAGGGGDFYAHIVPENCNYPLPAVADAGEDITVQCHTIPYPMIGNPASGCGEDTYQWVADPPEALSWLLNPTSCTTPVIIPDAAYMAGIGSAQFMLMVNEGMCDENVDAVTVYLDYPPIHANAGADGMLNTAPICNNEVYLGEAATPGYSYSWSPTAGLNFPNYPNPEATYDPSLSYPVTYTVTTTLISAEGCARATDDVIVSYKQSMPCILDLSTGYLNGALTGTGADDFWKYIADHTGPIAPVPMHASSLLSSPSWVANGGSSRWIRPPGSSNYFPPDDVNGRYRFERRFVINSDPDDITDVELQVIGLAMDNSGYFFINGHQVFNPTTGGLLWIHPSDVNAASNFNTLHSFASIPIDMSDLNTGVNKLMIDMNNQMNGVNTELGVQMHAILRFNSCRPCSQAISNPSSGGGSGGGSGDPKSLLQEDENEWFWIYPNPNNGTFTVEVLFPEMETALMLLNAVGEVVWEGTLNSDKTEISIHDLPTGVYFAKISQSGIVRMQKIVIE